MFKRKAKRVPAGRRPIPKSEPIVQKGFGTEMPPQKRLVEIYFDQKNRVAEAAAFYAHYQDANWSSPKGAHR